MPCSPVLPELVEANTVFVLLRLGRREEARSHLQAALQKYPNDATGNLAGIEALLLREAAETGFPCHPLFEKDANLDPIRQDATFQALMADLRKQWISMQAALFPDRK
jgi:hypothetical protein